MQRQATLPRAKRLFRNGLALLGAALVTTACGQQQAQNEQSTNAAADAAPTMAQTGSYSGQGRNRLCLQEGRAGFIVYAGAGDSNCSVRGTAERNGDRLVIRPDGDQACSIDARETAQSLTLGPVTPSCRYYCGPEVSFADATFARSPAAQPATDLVGDPLC